MRWRGFRLSFSFAPTLYVPSLIVSHWTLESPHISLRRLLTRVEEVTALSKQSILKFEIQDSLNVLRPTFARPDH